MLSNIWDHQERHPCVDQIGEVKVRLILKTYGLSRMITSLAGFIPKRPALFINSFVRLWPRPSALPVESMYQHHDAVASA